MGVQRLIDLGFEGYRGWGEVESEADFRATGGQGKETRPSSPSSGAPQSTVQPTFDVVDQARRISQFASEQNKPLVQSLEAQRQPLIDRYSALLDEIKGGQKTAEQRQSTTTSREFGRRGIPLSSGLFDQTLTDVLNPITRSYTNLYKETGAGREQDLLSLAREIANLQAGNPQQSVGQALQLGGYQKQAQSLAAQQASQQFQQQLLHL